MNTVLGLLDGGSPSSWVLAWLLRALFLGTLLAGMTWIVTTALRRRVPAAFHAALWTLVLIKFLVPMGPSWSHSMASICQRVVETGTAKVAAIDPPEAPQTAEDLRIMAARRTVTGRQTVADHRTVAACVKPVSTHRASQSYWDWKMAVVVIYLAAVAFLLAVRIHAYGAFCSRCRALPRADAATLSLVASVCRRLGVRRIPSTSISDEPAAPFVIGLSRPMLVLANRHLALPDELETVIVHEVAHLRRGDLLIRSLQWTTGTLLFFWPVVRWVNRRIDTAREHACDEWALRRGKLTPGSYARCLLNSARAMSFARDAYHPACMAGNPSTIERRIDLILESQTSIQGRRKWGLLTLTCLPAWSLFSLAGAAEVVGQSKILTEEGVKQRSAQLYYLVAEHVAADFDRDGVLSYTERDAYLVALAMINADAFVEEFPYADRNHSENLDLLEAHDAIKAVTLIAYADRRETAETEPSLNWEFCHKALDAQEWLLDNMTAEPSTKDLDNIWSVVRRVQGPPHGFAARMFNHGGLATGELGKCRSRIDRNKFQELENQIALVETKLNEAVAPAEVRKLQTILSKLQVILTRLQETDVDDAD